MDLLINVLEQGLLFSLVAIGVYITYKILDFPDLSVDGTYPLGACITGILLSNNINPLIAVVVSTLGGAIAGFTTAFLHVKLKITNLMSGILVMIALYSVNLLIMGRSNIPLFTSDNFFKEKILLNGINIKPLLIIVFVIILIKIIYDIFMKTKIGFLLKAVGDNEKLVTSLGVNKDNVKILGLMISNALVALSGGLTAQYNGLSDVGMGNGIVVKGLASVIIGTSILSYLSNLKSSTRSIIGSIIYYAAITIALKMNVDPNLLNLITAMVIIIALSLQNRSFLKRRNYNA